MACSPLQSTAREQSIVAPRASHTTHTGINMRAKKANRVDRCLSNTCTNTQVISFRDLHIHVNVASDASLSSLDSKQPPADCSSGGCIPSSSSLYAATGQQQLSSTRVVLEQKKLAIILVGLREWRLGEGGGEGRVGGGGTSVGAAAAAAVVGWEG